jgi:hypothetical protein
VLDHILFDLEVDAQFSVTCAIAFALLRGKPSIEDFTDEAVRAHTDVAELAQRIGFAETPSEVPDPVVDAPPDYPPYSVRPSGVLVHTRDGRRLVRARCPAQTFEALSVTFEDVAPKHRACAAYSGVCDEECAEAILENRPRSGRCPVDRRVAGTDERIGASRMPGTLVVRPGGDNEGIRFFTCSAIGETMAAVATCKSEPHQDLVIMMTLPTARATEALAQGKCAVRLFQGVLEHMVPQKEKLFDYVRQAFRARRKRPFTWCGNGGTAAEGRTASWRRWCEWPASAAFPRRT